MKKKLVVASLAVAIVSICVLGGCKHVIEEIGNKAKNIAVSVTEEVSNNENVGVFVDMLSQPNADNDSARAIEGIINSSMERTDAEYIYVIRYTDATKNKAEFLINWEDTSEYWGNEFELYPEAIEGLSGNLVVDSSPTTDEDGTVITAYAPVKVDGEVLACICADMDASGLDMYYKVYVLSKGILAVSLVCFVLAIVECCLGKLKRNN